MSDRELLIAKDIVLGWSWQLPDITDIDQPPHSLTYKYSAEGYGLLGRINHGFRSEEEEEVHELIIRIPRVGYFSTEMYYDSCGDAPWVTKDEEGTTFVVWNQVMAKQVTRYVWIPMEAGNDEYVRG
jgi:hypothetical protein